MLGRFSKTVGIHSSRASECYPFDDLFAVGIEHDPCVRRPRVFITSMDRVRGNRDILLEPTGRGVCPQPSTTLWRQDGGWGKEGSYGTE